MSDNKKINQSENDGLAELMNAFGGYTNENETDDTPVTDNGSDGYTDDDLAIELPEIPLGDEAEETEANAPLDDAEAAEDNVSDESAAEEEKPSVPAGSHAKPKKNKAAKPEKRAKDNKKAIKEIKENKEKKEKKPAMTEPEGEPEKAVSPVRLVIVLTVICAAMALLLASVNHFTEARIAENNAKAMLSSIRDIFDESVQAEEVTLPEESSFESLYLVIKNGGVCGYAASVSPAGFGGPMNLMIGVESGGSIVGVEIVSMSETPGLGSRVGGDDFLSRFKGMSGDVTVDAISGATISSKAVMAGVNSVTKASVPLDLEALAAERGMSVVPYDASVNTTETAAPVTTENVTESPETKAPETAAPVVTEAEPTPPDVSKGDTPPQNIVADPNNVNHGVHAEYEEDTAEYETLTTEPETSEPEDSAVSSAE